MKGSLAQNSRLTCIFSSHLEHVGPKTSRRRLSTQLLVHRKGSVIPSGGFYFCF